MRFNWQYQVKAEPIQFAEAPAETITVDKWMPHTPPLVFKRKKAVSVLSSFFRFSESVTLDDWNVQYQTPPRAKDLRYTYPSLFRFDGTDEAPAETITIDKWFRLFEIPVRKERRLDYNSSFNPPFPVDDQNSLDRWHQNTNTPFFPKPRAIDFTSKFAPVFIEEPAEEITVDKWFVQHHNPLKRLNISYRYPSLFQTLNQTQIESGITPDMWFSESLLFNPNSRKDFRRTYPSFFIDANFGTAPTPPADVLSNLPMMGVD